MNLTSWRRLQYALGGDIPLTDTAKNKRRYLNWIPAISDRVETFLNRRLELIERTDYFDSLKDTLEYFVDAYPITEIASVYSDSTGEYNGSESPESDYYTGKDSRSIVLETAVKPWKRGLRFIYTGGLATHGTQSQFTLSGVGSTPPVVNKFVQGRTSEAMGYIKATDGSSTMTIEVLYGKFEVGEVVDCKDGEEADPNLNQYATLATATVRCLAELHPTIVQACELEIRYMDDHRSDYENISTMKNMTTRKNMKVTNDTINYELVSEVAALLQPYVNIHL